MKIQPLQMTCFSGEKKSENKLKKLYRGATGLMIAAGVCCLASDRLFKSPKNLPTKLNKFGFWTSWAGLAMVAAGIGKIIYDSSKSKQAEEEKKNNSQKA